MLNDEGEGDRPGDVHEGVASASIDGRSGDPTIPTSQFWNVAFYTPFPQGTRMQTRDQKKRKEILKVAERLFANKAFHEVKLDDIATGARVGKGTIYIYFKDKQDLYLSLVREGMLELLEGIKAHAATPQPAPRSLGVIIAELAQFRIARPLMFQLIRSVMPGQCDNLLLPIRSELAKVIEQVIRRGVRAKELIDPHPELTSQIIMASVRGAVLFGPANSDSQAISRHIMRTIGEGLLPRQS